MTEFRRAGIFLLAILLLACSVQAAELHLRVLDVGEGQAVLLHKKQRALLIDTGHAGVARQVLRRIAELEIRTLDYLILTHLHPDHASGLFRINEAFPEARVMDSCYPQPGTEVPDMIRWTAEALDRIENRACLVAGDRITWGETTIDVLWPLARPEPGAPLNQTSLVLQVAHNGRKFLIMGDAGQQAEESLLAAGRLAAVDLLLVGHHGADDATGRAFLERVRPGQAIISTNRDNIRGYPSASVMQRLQALSGEVLTTYADGEVHVVF